MRGNMKKIGKSVFQLCVKRSPVLASKLIYLKTFRKRLNLKNPQTLNEKLMWLKLYEDNALKVQCADKLAVRNYIRERGYAHILLDLYDVYDCAEAIDFTTLPDRFVVKCTHGSGFNVFCEEKSAFDEKQARAQLKRWQAVDYGLQRAELHYSKITPRILAERLLEKAKGPLDYQIHCFNGKPQLIEVILGSTAKKEYILFNTSWELLPVNEASRRFDKVIERPKHLEEMLTIARTLSEAFTYVRVDLYDTAEVIYFSELTFTPDACLDRDFVRGADFELGKLLDLTGQKRPSFAPR